jgi:hypothetical protein
MPRALDLWTGLLAYRRPENFVINRQALHLSEETAMPDTTPKSLADDLLNGADEIAAYTGLDVRAVYYASARGYLPTFKCGHLLQARKSELNESFSAKKKSA